jgi:DNA-binding CsgD family transcriptional regulator
MLDRLDPSEYLARSRVHLGIAWISAALRRPTRAHEHVVAVDARATVLPDIAVRFHNVSTWVAALRGDVERFRTEHAAWLDAARASGLGALGGALSGGAKWFADFGLHDEAQQSIAEALRIARDSRNRHAEECTHAAAVLCYILSGELARARAALDAVPTTTDNRVNVVFATAAGSLVGAHTGDAALIEKWFDGFEATICAAPEPECGAGFAEILVRRDRRGDAEALLHRVLPDCESMRGDFLTLLAVGRYGTPRDRARARTYLARAAAASPDIVEGPALMLFDAYIARAEGGADASVAFARRAADGFARLRMPLLEAAALEAAGEAASAAALFRRCGALYDVRRIEEAQGAVASESIDETAAMLALLSPREREIATLAAGGRTNLEIAKTLSITHKTVEKHLSAAYRKVGVSSRAALRPYVLRGGADRRRAASASQRDAVERASASE